MNDNTILKISFLMVIIFLCYNLHTVDNINIYIGNSFRNFYHLPNKTIQCMVRKNIYKCSFIKKNKIKYHASIYNGNRKFPNIPKYPYNIIITTEKLSQVKFMKKISEGKYKHYHLAVDYRLFNSKYHISRNIYSYFNLTKFLETSKYNYDNISSFMKRKNCVYIQKVHYKNRQYMVKEMMKYMAIDSFGNDLNNKKWPKNISKDNKIEVLKRYKFCIAIENSVVTWKNTSKYEADNINNDYVTEKLTDCLLAGCIPIYFGPKNVDLFIPHHNAIINFADFKSLMDISNYINKIQNIPSALEKHLIWHNNISRTWFIRFNSYFMFSYCDVCNKVKQYYFSIK